VRVRVDAQRCAGHGRCYVLAPEVYEEDERGHCVVIREEPPTELAEPARLGAHNCPEEAISVDP